MTKEQPKNANTEADAPQTDDGDGKYERSTIEFPYNDLDDAVALAKAVHENAGISCTLDQLAAYLNQSMTSGAFRLRVSNARTFGLTDNERGEVKLTTLGRQIADPKQEAAARVEAFLHVPLYSKIHDQYRGYMLPPAAALEKFMREVGVSSKQTGKARQALMRSARQAGFFATGEDRLVRPAGPGTKPIPPKKEEKHDGNGHGSGNGGGPDDPLIKALIEKLPPKGSWPVDERVTWFRMLAMAFQMTYGHEPEITIAKAEG